MGNTESHSQLQTNIQTLLTANIGDSSAEFWVELFSLPGSSADIASVLSMEELRLLCDHRPSNLKSLVHKSILQLELLVEKPELRSTELCKYTDTAVWWLTRVLPFMLDPTVAENFKEFWWDGEAQRLVSVVLRLLFCPNYTLPATAPELGSESVKDVLWGSVSSMGIAKHWRRRTDLLGLLLCCLSQEIQEDVGSLGAQENLWRLLVCNKGLTGSAALCLSIISILGVYEQNSRSWLPYTENWSANELEALVLAGLQVMNSCLINIPTPLDAQRPESLGDQGPNIYVATLQGLTDLRVLASGLHSGLKLVIDATNTYLPGSSRAPVFTEELAVMFFRCLTLRPDLAKELCSDAKANDIAEVLIYLILTYKHDPHRLGLVQQAFFIIHSLSVDREFGNALNLPYTKACSFDIPAFSGTYADMIFLSFTQILHSMPPQLAHFQFTILLTLSNM